MEPFEIDNKLKQLTGPERPTFTMKHPAEYPVFNSITDNPTIGDERFFVQIGEINQNKPEYRRQISVKAGKEYLVYIYFHNNASSTFNTSDHGHKGIALETSVSTSFSEIVTRDREGVVSAKITSSNAIPSAVWSGVVLTTSEESVHLRYVEGSAKIYCDWPTNGKCLSSAMFSDDGTLIGLTDLDGAIPGCEEYHGVITYVLLAE